MKRVFGVLLQITTQTEQCFPTKKKNKMALVKIEIYRNLYTLDK